MNFGCVLTLNLTFSLLKPKGMLSIYILLMDFTNNFSAFKNSVYFLILIFVMKSYPCQRHIIKLNLDMYLYILMKRLQPSLKNIYVLK